MGDGGSGGGGALGIDTSEGHGLASLPASHDTPSEELDGELGGIEVGGAGRAEA